MWKFLLISLVIWFFVKRLMRFNFVMYRGDFRSPQNPYPPRKPEGSITIDSSLNNSSYGNKSKDGDYIDFEEVK